MKAAILVEPGKIEIRELDIPDVPKDGAVLNVKAALTCGTDLKAYLRGHPMIPMPGPFGHEYAGDIVELGPKAPDRFKPGMPIMGVHSAPCNKCPACQRGQQNLCETIMETKTLGAYAEHLVIPGHVLAQNCYPMDKSLSFETAAFLEPLACVVHGQQLVPFENLRTACVFGAGPIGLLHLLLLKSKGIHEVFVVEPGGARRALADRLGGIGIDPTDGKAVLAIREKTKGLGADLTIECSGRAEVWSEAMLATRPGGWAVMFGGLPGGAQGIFDAHHLHYNEIRLVGCFHFTPADVRSAGALLSNDAIDPTPLLTGHYQLDELTTAFKRLKQGDGIKFAIYPQERS